jgi:hypothetical protein
MNFYRDFRRGYARAWLHILFVLMSMAFFAFYFYVGGAQ